MLVKDDSDGLKDVSQYKEKGDRYLDDKALRYSFCVLNVTIEQNKEIFTVWGRINLVLFVPVKL